MNLKKTEEERRALVSRLRTLCLRERVLGGTVTRTMVGNSLRMTVTDRVDGTTWTLFVPADRQEEVARWNGNWKEMSERVRPHAMENGKRDSEIKAFRRLARRLKEGRSPDASDNASPVWFLVTLQGIMI